MTVEPNKIYLPSEVADILRCGRTNVYDLMASGELATTSVGAGKKGKRVLGSAILAFLETRTEGGPKPQGSFKFLKTRAG